jgi:outer membrane protein OmpA-like peptidoglycan-associated protein
MQRLSAIIGVWLLALSGAMAQEQIAGRTLELVFQVEPLVFKVESFAPKVENIAGQVQALQVKETATETRIELPADILFDFDKDQIRGTAEPALKQAAELIRKAAKGTVRIEGHTDSKGADAYNVALSQRRARSVQKWLTEQGALSGVRFAIQGFGKSRPAVSNTKPDGSDDPDGRQKNRRVEIVFARR